MSKKKRSKRAKARKERRRGPAVPTAPIKPRPAKPRQAKPSEARDFICSSGSAEKRKFDPAALPIVRAYVPLRDAWIASGTGTAGILREHPDGDRFHLLFLIDLSAGGLRGVMSRDKVSAEFFERSLEEIKEHGLSPLEEGPVELASEYIWGSYALTEAAVGPWPSEMDRLYMSAVPRPPGTKQEWVERLVGPEGSIPPQFLQYLAAHPPAEDQPEEVVSPVFVTMMFQVYEPLMAAQKIRARKHDFLQSERPKGQVGFDWYYDPERGSSVLWTPDRKVPVGTLTFEGDKLQAQTAALHLAARLISILEQEARIDMNLVGVRWDDPQDLMRQVDEPSLIVKP